MVNRVEGAGEDLHKDVLRPRARDGGLRDYIGGALLVEEERLLGGGNGHVRGVAVDAWEVLGGGGGLDLELFIRREVGRLRRSMWMAARLCKVTRYAYPGYCVKVRKPKRHLSIAPDTRNPRQITE